MTPADVDTALAPLEVELHRLASRRWDALDTVEKYGSSPRPFDKRRAERAQAEADELVPQIEAARDACRPYRAEYARRPWPRVFWCLANGGHAHRGRECSTLYPRTALAWLPEWSGRDEAEIVEAAGSSACTVCYPSAPVDVLARPSSLRPAVEAREAKAARDAARAAAAAAKAADHAEGLTAWGHRPDLAAQYAGHAELYLAALAHKHGRTIEDERAELAPKVEARRKKDARERAKYAAR